MADEGDVALLPLVAGARTAEPREDGVEEEEDGVSAAESSEDEEEDSSDSEELEEDEEEDAALRDAGWAKYVDDNFGQAYYFNHVSGESQWTRPVVKAKLQQRRGPTPASGASSSSSSSSWFGNRNTTVVKPFTQNTREQARLLGEDQANQDESDSGSSSEDLVTDDDDDEEAIRTTQDVDAAVRFYVWSSVFHVVCIEGPMAAMEGIFRGMWTLLLGCAALVFARSETLAPYTVRGGLELMAAGLTLLIPGSLLFAYKDMIDAWRDGRLVRSSRVDDWEMGHIPSLLGRVDARSFVTVTAGQGAFATNVRKRNAQS